LERRLEDDQVGAEGEDRADAQVSVDDEQAPDDQDQDEADLRQVLDRRGEARPQVGVLDVRPLEPVGRLGQGSSAPAARP